MAFWLFMLVCDLLTPVILILGGWLMWRYPPKDINALSGYRTKRSMKNQDTWLFAHEYCGKLWYKLGLIQLIPSLVPLLCCVDQEKDKISTVGVIVLYIQMAILIASIFPTEAALKRTFDDNGNRRG